MFEPPTTMHSMIQLHVALNDIKPMIWRRLVMPAGVPLDVVHHILQVSFAWDNCHLHAFMVGDIEFGVPTPDAPLVIDERAVRLGAVARKGATFKYQYDFGDDWEHVITVEKITHPHPSPLTIECIDGARACPPEDCGGPHGYEDLLAILADPKHPEHKERMAWLGEPFDPEAFDIKTLNKKLQIMLVALEDAMDEAEEMDEG